MSKRNIGEVSSYPSEYAIAAMALKPESSESLANYIVHWANAGDPDAVKTIDRVSKKGVSNQLFASLHETIKDMQICVSPSLSRDIGGLSWEAILSSAETRLSREAAFALVLSTLVHDDYADRILRCGECDTYFVGDPRSTWCSKTCGSRNRQRVYQERKREEKKRAVK